MNSRDRVRAVINHRTPDYIPNGLGGCETAGLHVVAYDLLQKILGVKRQPPRVDTFMTNAVFERDVIAAMEGDIILIASPLMCRAPVRGYEGFDIDKQWKIQELFGSTFRVPACERFVTRADGSVVWETQHGVVCPPGFWYFDDPGGTDLYAEFDYPDPDDYNPPDTFTDEFLRGLEETARFLYTETDLSLCLGETVTDLQFAPGGPIGKMLLLKEDPGRMKAYLDKAVDASLKQIAILEQAAGKYVDIMCIADDIGDNRGITIGPDLWRELYKPYYKRLFQGWHARTGMKINLHTCGSMEAILDDLIECGVDIYNPVQISAFNMNPRHLKERFGGRLVFWGGDYDSQLMKGRGDEEVYEHVKNNLKTFGENGGHIFSGVHNLPADLSEGHLRAALRAWRENRR